LEENQDGERSMVYEPEANNRNNILIQTLELLAMGNKPPSLCQTRIIMMRGITEYEQ